MRTQQRHRGDGVVFSAGPENKHGVRTVTSGTRYSLLVWLTLDEAACEDSRIARQGLPFPSALSWQERVFGSGPQLTWRQTGADLWELARACVYDARVDGTVCVLDTLWYASVSLLAFALVEAFETIMQRFVEESHVASHVRSGRLRRGWRL